MLFAKPTTPQGVLCPGSVKDDIDVTLTVQVWAPPGLDRKRLQRHTFGLENTLLPLGIHFALEGGVRSIAKGAVFVGAGPAGPEIIAEAEAREGPLSRTQKEMLVAPLVTAPLRRHLERLSPKSNTEIQVFFVDRIADVQSPVGAELLHPAGLTLSPFAAASGDAEALAALIGRPLRDLPAPVIFLSMYELGRMPMAVRVSTLAHEFGHAFGLDHGGGRENLMSPLRHGRCLPGLNSQQVSVLRETLNREKQ